jgi:hypothetical protein
MWDDNREVCTIWIEEFLDHLDIVDEQNSMVELLKEELESAFESFKNEPSPRNQQSLEMLSCDYADAWRELQEMEAASTAEWAGFGLSANDCTKGNPDFVNARGE